MQQEKKARNTLFRKRLDKLRGTRSNTDFARFLGLSRQTVGFYLNGNRVPDLENLRIIAEKCGVTTDYLIGLSDAPSKDNIEINVVCEYTKLSQEAVENIHRVRTMNRSHSSKISPFQALDLLLKSDNLLLLVTALAANYGMTYSSFCPDAETGKEFYTEATEIEEKLSKKYGTSFYLATGDEAEYLNKRNITDTWKDVQRDVLFPLVEPIEEPEED